MRITDMTAKRACVLGTGSWATALALVLADEGHRVRMLGIEESEIRDINQNRRNGKYFGNVVNA